MRTVTVDIPAKVEYRGLAWTFSFANPRRRSPFLLQAPGIDAYLDAAAVLDARDDLSRTLPRYEPFPPESTADGTALRYALAAADAHACAGYRLLGTYDRKTGIAAAPPGASLPDGLPRDGLCSECGTRRGTLLYAVQSVETGDILMLSGACLARRLPRASRDRLDELMEHPQARVDFLTDAISRAPRYPVSDVLAAALAFADEPFLGNFKEFAQATVTGGTVPTAVACHGLEAEMLRLWALDEYDEDSEFAAGLREACALATVPVGLFGLLGKAPQVSRAWYARKAAETAGHDLADGFSDGYAGAVGERVAVERAYVHTLRLLPSGSTLVTFRSPEGLRLTWFAFNPPDLEQGDIVTVTGTVKKHEVFRGATSTVLTRCRIG